MAATQYSIRLVKTFPYRGDPLKEFSNRYYFDGGDPGDATTWHNFMDAVVTAEKAIYLNDVHIVAAYGYAPGSEVAVASQSYTTAGTIALSTGHYCPGDCAAVLRMATTKRSTKNHPVYVFSYYHRVLNNAAVTNVDDVYGPQKTAIETYGTAWLDGITVGGRTYKRTTPDGHATTGRFVEPTVGHRDFPG